MKKIYLGIMTLLMLFTVANVNAEELPEVTDREKVKIYLFRGDGCNFCHDAVVYFNDLKGEYDDYVEFVIMETNNDDINYNLMNLVKEEYELFDEEGNIEPGVPYLVVGDYDELGFVNEIGEALIDEALKIYESGETEDKVADIMKENDDDYTLETLEEACELEGISYWDTFSGRYGGYIMLGVLLVVVGGLGYLIFVPAKKSV